MHLPIILHSLTLMATVGLATRKVSFVDNFDSANPTISALSKVGDTAGGALGYRSFDYGKALVQLGFLAPDTPPITIGNDFRATLADGPPYWRTINSTVLSFDEKSIAYACIQTKAGIGGAPKTLPCTIQLAGKKAGSQDTVLQDLRYDPGVLGTSFNKTTFGKSFTGLMEVDVAVIVAPVAPELITVLFDTHTYDAYLN